MRDLHCYWVGFNLVKGIGAVRMQNLLDYFGDVESAWQGSPQSLHEAGLSSKLTEQLVQHRKQVDLDTIWESIQAQGIKVLTWMDEDYPRRLKEIDQSPPVLYLLGEMKTDDDWAVAIVGTRRVTAYGRQVTEEIATSLAQSGLTIISGLARGVDSIAHLAALNAGGRTMAVLGNGVDIIYPAEHRHLTEKIIEAGALISDYPPGTAPEAVNFPPRNRIISGLSLAVIIVEAGEKSGALITANFAAEQGRDVFAVPGNINAPQSVGTNRLIQQGAHPYLSVQDLIDNLNLHMVGEQRQARSVLPADAVEAKFLTILTEQPLHVDEISNLAETPIAIVTSTLAMMELKGMVRQVGGMQYVAVKELGEKYEVEGKKNE
jgi:DNA processing protein